MITHRGSNQLKFHIAHTPSDDCTRCDHVPKYFSGAHKTNNDALEVEGGTQKTSYISQEIATENGIGWLLYADPSIHVSQIASRCWFFDPMSVWKIIAANRNWHFQFICYFSTNNEDTIVLIASFDPASNSKLIPCLTLLWDVAGASRLLKGWSHHGQKMDPPYQNYNTSHLEQMRSKHW